MTVRAMGRMTLLVRDYEQALAFYRDRLGFHVLHDSKSPNGGRYLHIGIAAQQEESAVGLWLMEAKGADAILVGRQAGDQPLLVLYTDDCAATIRQMQAAKVEIRKQPDRRDGAIFAHVADLYGNEIVIVELEKVSSVTQNFRVGGVRK